MQTTAVVLRASTSRSLVPSLVEVPESALAEALAQFDEGLYLRAYRVLEPFGPLKLLAGTRARILGARIANQLGAPRLAAWLSIRAWQDAPEDTEACYYRSILVTRMRGPLAALDFLSRATPCKATSPESHADLLTARAAALGMLRDFESAERALAEAELISPDSPWLQVERADVLDRQDRPDEAIAHAQRALELRPGYRPALQMLAHLFIERSRDDDALELLTEWAPKLESPALWTQLGALQRELERPREAADSLLKAAELSILMERRAFCSIAAMLADVHADSGDVSRAVELAELAGNDFHTRLAKRMAQATGTRRVKLPVPFVRQNHLTCAPATLTSIAKLWQREADHLEVAEAICYDGTPSHSERRWAEEHGWATRAFTVTWDSAVALLDRGIAFTLVTADVGNSHLQAVIGYDERRRLLLVRDPSVRYLAEYDADAVFERYAFTGPRGMAMVPREQAHLFDGLSLPDAECYDLLDAVESALAAHDRTRAADAVLSLERQWPDHRITLQARRALARYDMNPAMGLVAADRLATQFPKAPLAQFDVLGLLGELGRRGERVQRLRDIVATGKADPFFWHSLAEELRRDAREHDTARFLFRRFVRYRASASAGYMGLAHLLWAAGDRTRALSLYRLATCLDARDEGCATSYFIAAASLRQRDEALAFLRDRFDRFGAKSGLTARTLCEALQRSDRAQEACEVLERAIALRPDDAQLLLFGVDVFTRTGRSQRAAELLERAQGRGRRQDWARAAAAVAESRGDLTAALGHWRAVVETEPLAVDAHRAIAQRLAETEGTDAALAHLRGICDRFPHHQPLHELYLGWLRERDLARMEELLAHLVDLNPRDAWVRRERAQLFGTLGRTDEAFAELEVARDVEPNSPWLHNVTAHLLARSGRVLEAREAFRAALRHDIDTPPAIDGLLAACNTRAEKEEALAFIHAELHRQVMFGPALDAWYAHAERTLPPEVLRQQVEALHAARGDLVEAWVILVMHLRTLDLHPEALSRAKEMTDRFPLVARAWLERALCSRAVDDTDDARASLERALELSPGWGRVAGELSELHERAGDADRALTTLERVLTFSRWDLSTHGRLALLHRRRGEPDRAREYLERALHIDPDYEFAWTRLLDWADGEEDKRRLQALSDDLTRLRPAQARVWLWHAHVRTSPDALEERLRSLARAIEIDPRLEDAHDSRAQLLAEAGRFDEAEAACRPAVFGDTAPLPLRGRAAWVRATRGDVRGAISVMQEIIAEFPGYYWGLVQLHGWCMDTRRHGEAAEAAQKLTEVAADEAESWSRLADAHAEIGNNDLAIAHYEKAIALAPSWDRPRLRLFDVALFSGALAKAKNALEGIPPENPFTAARHVQLAAKHGDLDGAKKHLPHALVPVDGNDWPIRTAVDAMKSAGWTKQVTATLEALLSSGQAKPEQGYAYGRELSNWLPFSSRRLWFLSLAGDAGVCALAGWLERVGEQDEWLVLTLMMWLRRNLLRSNARLWGTVGYALASQKQYARAVIWLADWRTRAGLVSWMMVNVTLALLARRKVAEAREASARALSLTADHTRTFHAAVGAWFAALDGDAATARARLEEAKSAEGSVERLAVRLTKALLVINERGREGWSEAHAAVAAAMAAHPTWRSHGVAPTLVLGTARAISAKVGGLRAWLWWRLM